MFSLFLMLATRTFHGFTPSSTTIQSASPHATRPHMDRDAVRFMPVVAQIEFVVPPQFELRITCSAPLAFIGEQVKSPYNRPPPLV
jgi:hypothetical protein